MLFSERKTEHTKTCSGGKEKRNLLINLFFSEKLKEGGRGEREREKLLPPNPSTESPSRLRRKARSRVWRHVSGPDLGGGAEPEPLVYYPQSGLLKCVTW